MRFDVFTLFPAVFQPYLDSSILLRARQNELLQVELHNIRDWSTDKHHTTDDTPYGGGGGMVMKCEPAFAAVEAILGNPPACPLILLSPQGRRFDQKTAYQLAELPRIGLFCGHYEGIDERIREHLVTDQISIGDYVLTGGELPALILIDAITRLIPGALGDPDGALDDSFASGLLEYPHYTRPEVFHNWEVPKVLLTGNHAAIAKWRKEQSLIRTLKNRSDLLEKAELSKKERELVERLRSEEQNPQREE